MYRDPIEPRARRSWGIGATAVVVIAVVAAGLAIWGWRATETARDEAFVAPNTAANPTPIPQAGRDLAAEAPAMATPTPATPVTPSPPVGAGPGQMPLARGDAAAADAVVGTPTGDRAAPPADIAAQTNVGATPETRRLENTGDVTAAIVGGQEATVKGTVAAFNAEARTLTLDNGNTYVLADNLQIGQGQLAPNVLQTGNEVQLTYRTDADARIVVSVTDLPDATPAPTGAAPATPAP